MTTYVEARDTLVDLVNTAWASQYPTVKVFWENALRVDLDKVGDSFLKVDVIFDDAMQTTMNDAPWMTIYGTLLFTLFIRDGLGVRETLDRTDFLSNLAKFAQVDGVVMWAPKPGKRTYKDGWRSYELAVPFEFDQNP